MIPSIKPLLLISLALILLLVTAGCLGNNTPYQQFNLNVNESKSFSYNVNGLESPFINIYARPTSYGYMILSAKDVGNYKIKISTNRPEDKVGVSWVESFQQQEVVGDKFNRHYETVPMAHWVGGRLDRCVSDKYSDCSMEMVLGDYGNTSELQIYIVGHGSGTIEVTRTG